MESLPAQEAQEVQWIERAQRGDREAFGLLVERYQRSVMSQVFCLVRRRDEAEDIAQEVFIKAFRAIRSYNFRSPFGAWLSRVAVNHCYDYLRKERASRISYHWQMAEESVRRIEAQAENPQGSRLDPEQQAVLRDFVGKLLDRAPAEDRVVLGLKELEGLSVEEIAEILKLNRSTVKVRLHRARKRMLEDLKRWREGR
jgi:RNA polymerase sigma-70 factor (ECF subfamily)